MPDARIRSEVRADVRADARLDLNARGATLLRGPGEEIVALALRTCPPSRDLPWIGGPHASAPHVDRILGGEFAGVVVDAAQRLDVDRLGAVLGAIRAGGHLLWLETIDGPAPAPMTERCARLLQQTAQHFAEVRVCRPGDFTAPRLPPVHDARSGRGPAHLLPAQREVADVVRDHLVHGGPPVLLSADRGRGKSTALGVAAAEALASLPGTERMLVCTARAIGAAMLMDAARARCIALGVDPERLRRMPVDALLDDPHADAPLLVDEAAALPVETLARLQSRHTRIVMATTQLGYEGTGQGFRLGFAARLEALHPDRRLLSLTEAIRFRAGDALEHFSAAIMGQNGASPDAIDPPRGYADEIMELPRQALAHDESQLVGVFQLLRAAHYRTRPSDLQRMLDDPAMRVWCVGDPRAPFACALALDEGGLDQALAAAMVRGERRPRGHLGPGVLAERLGIEAGARLRSVRIVRIAVAQTHRRAAIGARLVEAVAANACARGCALMTSSFGASAELMAFWRAVGFEMVRMGERRERSTGLRAAFVSRALDDAGAAVLETASTRGARG